VERPKDVSSKVCSTCKESKSRNEFNKNKTKLDGLQYQCKACVKIQRKKYLEKNKEDVYRRNKEWRKDNPDYMSNYLYSYYRDNKPYYFAQVAKRRSARLNATPPWLTDSQNEDIQNFYWLSKDLTAVSGEIYHVDHIVPLQGKNICGLHVPWNLQILPADINLSKGNSYANDA